MPIASTIPTKIPKTLLRQIKKEQYSNLILYTLGVFGPHKKKELVNDPKIPITNRMDEKVFQKWASNLKDDKLIVEYLLDNELYYKITNEGEDELMKHIEEKRLLRRGRDFLIDTFSEIFKESIVEEKFNSKSVSGYTISYKDFVFGLLSVEWRISGWFEAAKKAGELKPENYQSFGDLLDYNAIHYRDRPALLYEDIRYTYKELNERINQYANYFLSIGLKKGDIINVFLENRPELMIMVGAMSKIGTIASLINTKQRAASLIHSLKINKAKAYVIGEELYQQFRNIINDLELTGEDKLFFLADKGELELPEGFLNLKEQTKDQETNSCYWRLK